MHQAEDDDASDDQPAYHQQKDAEDEQARPPPRPLRRLRDPKRIDERPRKGFQQMHDGHGKPFCCPVRKACRQAALLQGNRAVCIRRRAGTSNQLTLPDATLLAVR